MHPDPALFSRDKMQVSAIEQESIDIDPDTKDLLDALDFKELAGIVVSATPARV